MVPYPLQSSTENKEFAAMYEEMVRRVKSQSFIECANSMILRRCFRDREKCEDEAALIAVYGKDSRGALRDQRQRTTMQILDKLYCFFAYAYDLGFAFRKDEAVDIANMMKKGGGDEGVDEMLVLVKKLLKEKKQRMMKTTYGKDIYAVIARRKVKFCTTTRNFMEEMKQPDGHDPKALKPWKAITMFKGIKERMQHYLKNFRVCIHSISRVMCIGKVFLLVRSPDKFIVLRCFKCKTLWHGDIL